MPDQSKGVAVITGASRGIGAACARLAARDGWDVCVNYAGNAEAAARVCAEVEAAGRRALAVQGDVSKEGDVLNLFAEAGDMGPVTAFVNNAGILDMRMPLAEMDTARIARLVAVNVTGALICAREAVRAMSKSRGGQGGAIVNVSSRASAIGGAGEYVDYAATKGAIDTLTLGLSKEVGGDGIRVNAVRPGLIETEIHATGGAPNRAHDLAGGVPMKRPGTAEEVAETIVWLMGDKSSYVNGALLDVGGGR
ncbi:SDR family oxidoreductase [Tepidamorphus sp. 3E244]|uniref:SDR family oxidoreductase n=1 Tax=Tepidamorphus sp. 3E244 TaxID=3385498 RepID=UPI0038FCAA1C